MATSCSVVRNIPGSLVAQFLGSTNQPTKLGVEFLNLSDDDIQGLFAEVIRRSKVIKDAAGLELTPRSVDKTTAQLTFEIGQWRNAALLQRTLTSALRSCSSKAEKPLEDETAVSQQSTAPTRRNWNDASYLRSTIDAECSGIPNWDELGHTACLMNATASPLTEIPLNESADEQLLWSLLNTVIDKAVDRAETNLPGNVMPAWGNNSLSCTTSVPDFNNETFGSIANRGLAFPEQVTGSHSKEPDIYFAPIDGFQLNTRDFHDAAIGFSANAPRVFDRSCELEQPLGLERPLGLEQPLGLAGFPLVNTPPNTPVTPFQAGANSNHRGVPTTPRIMGRKGRDVKDISDARITPASFDQNNGSQEFAVNGPSTGEKILVFFSDVRNQLEFEIRKIISTLQLCACQNGTDTDENLIHDANERKRRMKNLEATFRAAVITLLPEMQMMQKNLGRGIKAGNVLPLFVRSIYAKFTGLEESVVLQLLSHLDIIEVLKKIDYDVLLLYMLGNADEDGIEPQIFALRNILKNLIRAGISEPQ